MMKFEMNGIAYTTDEETLNVLREQIKMNNLEVIALVMGMGLQHGKINEVR